MKNYRLQIVLKNSQTISLEYDELQERDDNYQYVIAQLDNKENVNGVCDDILEYSIPYESIAFVMKNYVPMNDLLQKVNSEEDNKNVN